MYASTLAFTTFVLFQFFNVMNARFDASTVFNRQLFHNRKLWLALAAVLVLQVVVVNWGPAQAVFDTVSLNLGDWILAARHCGLRSVARRGAQARGAVLAKLCDRKLLQGVGADR